jgi:hypothetical protein
MIPMKNLSKRERETIKFKLIKDYGKLIAKYWLTCKPQITKGGVGFTELHWCYKSLKDHREALAGKSAPQTFMERREEKTKSTFNSRISYWKRRDIKITCGPNVAFKNNQIRRKGQTRKPKCEIVLKPTYLKRVHNKIPQSTIRYRTILDANEISISHDKIRIFEILHVDLCDDMEIRTGFLCYIETISFYSIRDDLHRSIRTGQIAIKNHIKKMMSESTV